jgi:hypothetical protein
VIILHEVLVDFDLREAILIVRLKKEAARIAKHPGLELPNIRERCMYALQSVPRKQNTPKRTQWIRRDL